MGLRKPSIPSSAGGDGGGSLEECGLSKRYPTVVAFISESKWEDGSVRERGKVTLFVEDGMVKAALTDPALGAVAFVSGRSFTSLMEAMEKGLTNDRLEWRRSKFARPRK